MIVPSLVWHTFGAYNVVIIITYIRRGLRVVVPISWAMRRPQFVERQQSSSTFFFVPFCEGFWVIFEVDFVAFFSKIGRIIMIIEGLLKC